MRFVQYQQVNVTLSAATFSRLEQRSPFNKRRVSDQAIEAIRVAVFTLYPPRTPEEWKDKSRYQGAFRHALLVSYDMVCYFLRRLMDRNDDASHLLDQPVQITLKVPIGLMSWVERIARSNQSTIPEATIYAIEYGLREMDSQRSVGTEGLRKIWREIFNAIRERFVKAGRI